jgi:hypothetical protein
VSRRRVALLAALLVSVSAPLAPAAEVPPAARVATARRLLEQAAKDVAAIQSRKELVILMTLARASTRVGDPFRRTRALESLQQAPSGSSLDR